MSGLNGIILEGRIYEGVRCDNPNPCMECDLGEMCDTYNFEDFCNDYSQGGCFRFSQELTDKLNNNGIQQKVTSAGL